ncbi:MAG TPA: sodium:solute symporter family protein [Thermoguttaceae bacterium]|nr:sodium:solute symporter family protein [Thermoguttaceae bacterium]
MNIPLLIVVVYIVVLFAIGYYASRLVKRGKEGFFLAGRRLPAPLVAVTLTGLAVGGATTIGVATKAFAGQGLAAGWYGVAWAVSAFVVGLVVSRRFRRLDIVTVPQLFEDCYDKAAHVACVAVQVMVQIVITSLQYVAGGAILHQLLPEVFTTRQHGMIFSAIVFIALTIVGGLWSASLGNILNVTLIYGGVTLAAVLSVQAAGGLDKLAELLPADQNYLHPVEGFGLANILIFTLVMVTCNIGFQATVQIAFAARSEKSARNGFLLGGLLILPVSFLAALIGVAAKACFPEIEDGTTALPKMVGSLDPLVAGITLAALWAADVSTACGLLLSSSTVVVRDVYLRHVRPETDHEHQLRLNRCVVLIIGVVTLALALQIGDILDALMQGLSLMTGLTVVILFTFYAPRLCRAGSAFWTILAGIAVMALWQLVPAVRVVPHVIYMEWIVCVAVFLAVMRFDTRRIRVPVAASDPLSV